MSGLGLTDCHCHLELIEEAGEGEAARAVSGAAADGVTRLVNIGLGPDNEAVVARARGQAGIHATVGWHPHQDHPPSEADLAAMAELCADPAVAAVGEVGLDYHWRLGYHEVRVEVQKESFTRMLELARQAQLPAVVHCREAHGDMLQLLEAFADVPIVMHAFSGDVEFTAACVERGIFMSVAGPVTYPSAGGLREALATAPLELLLVETDAPFLPPQPWRGKPSRPAMVVETARRLAELKGVTVEELAAVTSANADQAFRFGAGTSPG